ncbi:HAD family hydrolase [Leptolyngbya cf. ectocarpi LEGE 11479]|uniref:HAD family hydrolase n=1 Tax=Leptolyngbya cf. ectocarpi LEGE 11479 TaxID=1828722 RepID=A0A928X427_LEPEC|nr:HAD family hydrolase [Leptolyngbya ectocarpi]MBE9066723.1 HAD family hydrolase [Leptolyngbya cf. ectocarpi LEGE 11479]
MLSIINQMSSFQEPSGQVLFCDFDGPIVDVSERYYRTYRLGLSTLQANHQERHGEPLPLQLLSKNQFWWMKRNRVADTDIAIRSGVPADLVNTLLQQVQRIVNHPHLLQWDSLQPGAETAIHQLKHAGIRLVLVTLRHPRQVQAFLQAHDLSQCIDEIFGALDINAAHLNRAEQKVALLERAITAQKNQGYKTFPTCMIGDTEADIIAGQRAGIVTVAVTNGIRSHDYLKRYQPTSIASNLLKAVQGQSMLQVLQAA